MHGLSVSLGLNRFCLGLKRLTNMAQSVICSIATVFKAKLFRRVVLNRSVCEHRKRWKRYRLYRARACEDHRREKERPFLDSKFFSVKSGKAPVVGTLTQLFQVHFFHNRFRPKKRLVMTVSVVCPTIRCSYWTEPLGEYRISFVRPQWSSKNSCLCRGCSWSHTH